MSEKKYTKEEIEKMKEKADIAVLTMTTVGVGIGFVPVMFDIAALMTAMGGGVVTIGNCYGFTMNKEDAGELIKSFFKAAGMTFSFIFAGQKIASSLLKSNPVSYVPSMIADAVLCGSTAYAVGSTSEKYFRRRAEGKKATAEDIRRWMEEGKRDGKQISKKQADEKAKNFKKDE